jgi:hypothetical protein
MLKGNQILSMKVSVSKGSRGRGKESFDKRCDRILEVGERASRKRLNVEEGFRDSETLRHVSRRRQRERKRLGLSSREK